MPELPDVEMFRRLLTSTSLRRKIARVSGADRRLVAPVSPRTFAAKLAGQRFVSARRHGKYLFARLDKGGWLALHFGMTGSLDYVRRRAEVPRFSRIKFEFTDGSRLVFADKRRLGHLRVIEDPGAFIASQKLGPDALARGLRVAAFRSAIAGRKCNVKSALMDQTAIAGVGNIYADEILYQARINPRRTAAALDDEEIARLFRQMRRVFKAAIARRAGSERFLERLPASYLLPHRVKGGRCPRCGKALRTMKVGGRTGYYCARCQS